MAAVIHINDGDCATKPSSAWTRVYKRKYVRMDVRMYDNVHRFINPHAGEEQSVLHVCVLPDGCTCIQPP